MKRTFWFGLGLAAGVAAARRARSAAHRITPGGAAENLGDAVRELAVAIGSFGADVRAGMAEREAELHATVVQRTGIDTASHHSGWMPSGEGTARARWAGGTSARA